MKTKIITLITLLTIVLSVSVTKATSINTNDAIVNVATNNINKIEASGNVEVYITNGDKDEVKVYDKYYSTSALVQDKDGVLRIASYTKDKLVVLVTVTDLRAITANGNASVKSYGKLSATELNVSLNNNASADLNLDAIVASFTVNDRAAANLSGNVHDYDVNYSQSSTINKTELAANNISEKNTTKVADSVAAENLASL